MPVRTMDGPSFPWAPVLSSVLAVILAGSSNGSERSPLTVPAAAKVVHVFLLAGQSNMEGQAVVDLDDPRDYNGGRGTLVRVLDDPHCDPRWKSLRAADGTFRVRDDVFVSYCTPHEHKLGPLSVGFAVYPGRHHFGPELEIGEVLGEHFAEPVLLVKTAWGGKSLAQDFRPPSAEGPTGPYYERMLAEFEEARSKAAEWLPELAGHALRVEGVFWFQGWNDGCNAAATAEYEQNLVLLIGDLRAALGAPDLPFVVGETGNLDVEALRNAQAAACQRPEVGEHVRFVPTRAFLRAAEDSPNTTHGHHWYGNAESYLEIGEALGRAMRDVVRAQ